MLEFGVEVFDIADELVMDSFVDQYAQHINSLFQGNFEAYQQQNENIIQELIVRDSESFERLKQIINAGCDA